MLLVAAGAWRWAAIRTARSALIDSVVTGEPAAAMQAFNKLIVLPDVDPELLREQIKNRENPVDFLASCQWNIRRENCHVGTARISDCLGTLL